MSNVRVESRDDDENSRRGNEHPDARLGDDELRALDRKAKAMGDHIEAEEKEIEGEWQHEHFNHGPERPWSWTEPHP